MAKLNIIYEYRNLKEAGFTSKNLEKGFRLVANQIQKRTGMKVESSFITTGIVNSYGAFNCITMIVGNKTAVRFCMEIGGNSTNKIVGIDIYYNLVGVTPDVSLDMQGYNILQCLDQLVEYIVNPKSANVLESKQVFEKKLDAVTESFLSWVTENKISDEYLVNGKKLKLFNEYFKYASNYKLEIPSLPTFNKVLDNYLKDKGLSNKYSRMRRKKSVKDKTLLSQEAKDMLQFIDEESGKSLDESLDMLESDIEILLNNVKNKRGKNLLIVTGKAGIGKSSTVISVVKSNVSSGYLRGEVKSPGDFYKLLYKNNGKIIIIDDSNDIVKKSSRFTAMLLALADSPDKRILSYMNKADTDMRSPSNPDGIYPQSFKFEGGLISISNLPFSKMEPAFLSRAIINEVETTDEGVIDAIEKNLGKFFNEYSMETKLNALEFLKRFYPSFERIDFRSYETCLSAFATKDNIKEAEYYCTKKLKLIGDYI